MQSFFEWSRSQVEPDNRWLILGKGPSFALRARHDLGAYRLLGLNHVVREQPVSIAHMIDADVVDTCGEALVRNAGVLVMPWYPHQHNLPGGRTLAELAAESSVLRYLAAEGRLLWYDLSTASVRHGSGPVVEATYFSAEAALNLLVLAGVRLVRTLGVDGGSTYSEDFGDLRGKTLLANGRLNFDLQFENFARTILRTGVDFAPLNLPSPVRIYVPSTPGDTLPIAVLRHSIRRRASLTAEVLPLPAGGGVEVVNEGQALVLAPGTQCLADLRGLWTHEVGREEIVVPADALGPSSPVRLALVDREAAPKIGALARLIHTGAPAHTLRAALSAPVRCGLSASWSPSGEYQQGRTRFLWYGNDWRQPWISRWHPFGHIWIGELLDGVAGGFIPADLVLDEVRRGHVRPSLWYQIEHRVLEPLLLPRRARRLDRGFHPPGAGGSRRGALVADALAVARAIGRQLERRAREYRARRRLHRTMADARLGASFRGTAVLGAADPVVPR